MKENKYDSKYEEYGQFLLSRENRFAIIQGIGLNCKFNESIDQQFVELRAYHFGIEGKPVEILYPLTENDLDRLIAKLQEMREEIRQPEE
jgi:hypothetical protein|nr:MAG TPA: hypothetical protein [Caudoviricetes sp.]